MKITYSVRLENKQLGIHIVNTKVGATLHDCAIQSITLESQEELALITMDSSLEWLSKEVFPKMIVKI